MKGRTKARRTYPKNARRVQHRQTTSGTAVRGRVDYYNTRRSHMERSHLPPIAKPPDEVVSLTRDKIEVRSYVGGLLQSFERKVA